MKIVGVIPARYGSSRFPGKPLAHVAGKPLLQWVIESAQSSALIQETIVATDHGEIFQLAEKLGVTAVMTSPELPSGSDRVYAAVLNDSAEIILNIQGDEPLLNGRVLDLLIEPFQDDPQLEMATLSSPLSLNELDDKNVVKVITNKSQNAIYFSRYGIPYSRVDAKQPPDACSKHVGLYAYRKSFLKKFCGQKPVSLELAEGLEQLRALYLGANIRVVSVDCELHGVDTPEDVQRVEAIINEKEIHGS